MEGKAGNWTVVPNVSEQGNFRGRIANAGNLIATERLVSRPGQTKSRPHPRSALAPVTGLSNTRWAGRMSRHRCGMVALQALYRQASVLCADSCCEVSGASRL